MAEERYKPVTDQIYPKERLHDDYRSPTLLDNNSFVIVLTCFAGVYSSDAPKAQPKLALGKQRAPQAALAGSSKSQALPSRLHPVDVSRLKARSSQVASTSLRKMPADYRQVCRNAPADRVCQGVKGPGFAGHKVQCP